MNGAQIRNLVEAICGAFTGDDLEQVVRFDLNEKLSNIVAPGSLRDVTFGLVQWSENTGRTEELIRSLLNARPNNLQFQSIANDLVVPMAATTDQPKIGKPPDGSQRTRIRSALIDQFPTANALKMLVDDSISVNLATIAGGANLTETAFELIQWTCLDPQNQLRPLLREAMKQRPASTELKALSKELFGD